MSDPRYSCYEAHNKREAELKAIAYEARKKPITCGCGGTYDAQNKTRIDRHEKSDKHQNWLRTYQAVATNC